MQLVKLEREPSSLSTWSATGGQRPRMEDSSEFGAGSAAAPTPSRAFAPAAMRIVPPPPPAATPAPVPGAGTPCCWRCCCAASIDDWELSTLVYLQEAAIRSSYGLGSRRSAEALMWGASRRPHTTCCYPRPQLSISQRRR